MDVLTQLRELEEQTAQDDCAPLADPAHMTVIVAHTMEDMMKAFAVRAAVYMSEQDCPYSEEFDGNDFTATQILGLIGDEPVATMRIRYFSDFAKPERLAVMRKHRTSHIAEKIVRFGIELCRQKGYRRLYGHAQARVLPFWRRFGFQPIDGPDFVFSDHRYIEVECLLEPHPDPVTIGKDPLVLIRPEGSWDQPGVLDQSSSRAATCPTGDKKTNGAQRPSGYKPKPREQMAISRICAPAD